VLSGRGLCDELITRPEESYRLWCVVCDLENLKNEEAMTHVGSWRHKKKTCYMYVLLNAFSYFKQNATWLVLYTECQQEGIYPEMYDFGPDTQAVLIIWPIRAF